MIGRIYGIRDKRDGRMVYVGSTVTELWVRWCAHLMACRCKTICQIHKYLKSNGPLNFEPVVLEECEIDVPIQLRECEQKWMDKYTNLQNRQRAVRASWCDACNSVVSCGDSSNFAKHCKTEKHKRNLKLNV